MDQRESFERHVGGGRYRLRNLQDWLYCSILKAYIDFSAVARSLGLACARSFKFSLDSLTVSTSFGSSSDRGYTHAVDGFSACARSCARISSATASGC